MTKICFVCLGNICRSPTAEAVMRKLIVDAGLQDDFELDSAGTGSWHVGARPDPRTRSAGEARGLTVDGRGRQFQAADFDRFDYVVALDRSNRENLLHLTRDDAHRAKVHLLRDFDEASDRDSDVPDPYYGGADGFSEVIDICDAACRGLLAKLRT